MTAFGGPDVLVPGDATDPVAGPGQALIEVDFANITFVETQIRAGNGPFKVEPPLILGNGVGGVLVSGALSGTRVVSSTGGTGGYAAQAAVDAEAAVPVPDGVSLDDAVALMADGRTALLLTRAAELERGQRVLVEAAAGGVGTLLVQLARAAGATVIGAVGGGRKADVVRDLGADLVVDYLDPDWFERVRADLGGVDVVFDGVGGPIARSTFGLLDPGGRMLVYGLASGRWADISDEEAAQHGVTVIRGLRAEPGELRGYTEAALAEAAAGRLRPVIGQRFLLDRAADAHAAIESRATIGKTLLDVR
jgi:NADPH:quinone reductase